jgi:hypothetical protein
LAARIKTMVNDYDYFFTGTGRRVTSLARHVISSDRNFQNMLEVVSGFIEPVSTIIKGS